MHLQMSSTTLLARLICCAKSLSVGAIDEASWDDRRDDMVQLVLPFVSERPPGATAADFEPGVAQGRREWIPN